MKKKIFLLMVSLVLYIFPATGFTAMVGNNYANVDTNIRIAPNATATRIGHFKKGRLLM